MSRPPKLNWDTERGKWRVRYKDKNYRFSGGSGKSDRKAKKNAQANWTLLKAEIDQTKQSILLRDNPDYVSAIQGWERVMQYGRLSSDETLVAVAEMYIADLRRRLEQVKLENDEDGNLTGFAPELESADFFDANRPLDELEHENFELCNHYDAPDAATARVHDMVWRDRLANADVRHETIDRTYTLAENIEALLAEKRSQGKTVNRVSVLKIQLKTLTDLKGDDFDVRNIDGRFVSDYWSELLDRKASGRYAASTTRDTFRAFKHFVKWLFETAELIERQPRNINSRQFSIPIEVTKVETLSNEQISRLLEMGTDRARLFVLLGLNCGMTQVDMSDLHPSEVDWTTGKITRRRSKTGHIGSVPTVSYTLWPQTMRLLAEFRSESADHVILNASGKPLRSVRENKSGHATKSDSVKKAIARLSKASGVKCTMKDLKKTSASHLQNDVRYNGLESLFLGHAPKSMAEKHYTKPPQELFDAAIAWLGTELGITEATPEK